MPLTSKGAKVKSAMEKTYGEKKGEQVFYATENKGSVPGLVADCEITGYMDAVKRGDSGKMGSYFKGKK